MYRSDIIRIFGWEKTLLNPVTRDDLLKTLMVLGAVHEDGENRLCAVCNTIQPGWPESWKNIAKPPGIIYCCANCAKAPRG
jgi:hypothetical protein